MRTMKQEHYFPIIILIHFVFWWIDLTLYTGDYEYTAQHIMGEVFSSWVVTVIAANFLMATRAKWVERIFGGLDKMFMIHRRSGLIAIVLLTLHFIVVPKYSVFTPGKPMGFLALVLLMVGVILSAAPVFKRKFKYHKWLTTHKFMGLFYIFGIAHSFGVPTLTSELPIVRVYVYGMALIGIIAWIYKAFLYNLVKKKLPYKVSGVTRFANDTVEILLKPTGAKLTFEAGQFAFVAFDGINKREAHPFTVSNHPSEEDLRFTVKSLGDYSAELQTAISVGTAATIRGPYGVFSYKRADHKKQLWLAGGIGITPFLAFLKELDSDYDITLVWSVKTEDQANYKAEIETIAAQHENIKFILWDSDTKGYFTIDKLYDSSTIKDHSVYICGPEVMRESQIKQLLEKGLSIDQVHYEEFSFR